MHPLIICWILLKLGSLTCLIVISRLHSMAYQWVIPEVLVLFSPLHYRQLIGTKGCHQTSSLPTVSQPFPRKWRKVSFHMYYCLRPMQFEARPPLGTNFSPRFLRSAASATMDHPILVNRLPTGIYVGH